MSEQLDAKNAIEMMGRYLIDNGYHIGPCVDHFIVGEGENRTFVVHFTRGSVVVPGEEYLEHWDTPSTFCAMLEIATGTIGIPDSL